MSSFTSDVSQSSSSLWSVETSSTEHFFAATFATLSSNLRVSERVRELPSDNRRRSVFRAHMSAKSVLLDSMVGKRLGVLHPLVLKSIRINRAESLVKCSRQKGQTGVRRGEVFSTMVLQQLKQRTCPTEKRANGSSEKILTS